MSFGIRKGFTIIEVMLFLAITAVMFVALIATTSGCIGRRRYDDTVSDFAEYLRRIYADVESTANPRATNTAERIGCTLSSDPASTLYQSANNANTAGRTNCGIYGKIMIFGENGDDTTVHTYDVIGDIIDNTHKLSSSTLSLSDALKEVHAEFLAYEEDGEGTCHINLVGTGDSYVPQWGGRIENASATDNLFRGAILVVRSPVNGTIHTLVADFNGSPRNFNVDSVLATPVNACGEAAVSAARTTASTANTLLANLLDGEFQNKVVDFCVNSDDVYGSGRRNIRLHAERADGTNAGAVEVVEADTGSNVCL